MVAAMQTSCLRLMVAACLLAGLAGCASVAPRAGAPANDPMSAFLAERGWSPPPPAPPAGPVSLGEPAAGDPQAPDASPAAGDAAAQAVVTAMSFLGVNYRRGGSSIDEGFDCSGFTRHVFDAALGVGLPRRAEEQARAPGLVPVPRSELRPGDLVFFNTLRRAYSHVGIYVGEGKFIHAPRSGAQVRIEDMRMPYWSQRYNGARRAEVLVASSRADGGKASPAQQAAEAAFPLAH